MSHRRGVHPIDQISFFSRFAKTPSEDFPAVFLPFVKIGALGNSGGGCTNKDVKTNILPSPF